MDKKKIESAKDGLFSIPDSYLPTHYFDVFNLLYNCENLLRIFVYTVLKAARGGDWAKTPIESSAADSSNSLDAMAKKRRVQTAAYGHIGKLPTVPMVYLTLDDLISIIANESNVQLFAPLFPASIENVYKPKLHEVRTTRNHLVHFRNILPKDALRLFSNIDEIMEPVMLYLRDLLCSEYKEFVPKQKADFYPLWTSLMINNRRYSSIDIKIAESYSWMRVSMSFPIIRLAGQQDLADNRTHNILKIDRYKLNKLISHQILGNLVCYTHTFVLDSPIMSDRVDFYLPYKRFVGSSENILTFFMGFLDDIEGEFIECHERYSRGDTIPNVSLRCLVHGANISTGDPFDLEEDDWKESIEKYDRERDEARKREDLRSFFIKRFGFAREDITEDWTYPEGDISAILYGAFPWLN